MGNFLTNKSRRNFFWVKRQTNAKRNRNYDKPDQGERISAENTLPRFFYYFDERGSRYHEPIAPDDVGGDA